jgi:hypothetical protein
MSCDGNYRKKSVGSFSETNPPGGGFRGVFTAVSTYFDLHLRREERADADAMECGRKESWGCWLRGNKLWGVDGERQRPFDKLRVTTFRRSAV